MNRREIALKISAIENRDVKVLKTLQKAFSKNSLKKTVVFTGPPGVGKSTVIAELAIKFAQSKKIAWLAIDPSSPQSGGSLLGDRIRLSGKTIAENLFTRSLSTRGARPFSKSIRDIAIALEADFDAIWIETAGTGQTESEIAGLGGLTVLLLQPETGDEVQWMKSGLHELADLFWINKSDLGGAEALRDHLIGEGISADRIVLLTAHKGLGLEDALSSLEKVSDKMDWKSRLALRHQDLARSLYIEAEIQKLQKAFSRSESKWIKNPYGRL